MRVAVSETRWIELKQAAKKHIERCNREGLCRACERPIKDGEELVRDIHLACYFATYRAVASGKTTWEERQREGRVGPKGKPGRKPTHPVSVDIG